ncbi:MAG: fibronectin type III domain-containing protein [Planctomycetota bacterium]|jgi:hypothetical protein
MRVHPSLLFARTGSIVALAILFGCGGGASDLSFRPDPPPAPGGLHAAATDRDVHLSWNAVSGAAQYVIYKDGERVQTVFGTQYTFRGLKTEQRYCFQVVTVRSGVHSGKAGICVTTKKDVFPYDPVSMVLAWCTAPGEVTLEWDAVSGSPLYEVYRDGALIDSVGCCRFKQTGLPLDRRFHYEIATLDSVGNRSAKVSGWVDTRLSPQQITGGTNSTDIVTDSKGVPHIIYQQGQDLRYRTRVAGAWTERVVAGNGAYHLGLAIDSSDRLHAVRESNGVEYLRGGPGDWTGEIIDAGGRNPSIAVDRNDAVHLVYNVCFDLVTLSDCSIIHVTNASGSWVSSTVVAGLGSSPDHIELAVHSDGAVHVAWVTQFHGMHATDASGSWVVSEFVDFAREPVALAIDPTGKPEVFCEGAIATKTGATWSAEPLDHLEPRWAMMQPDMRIDANGARHVVYSDDDHHYNKLFVSYLTDVDGEWRLYRVARASLPVFEPRLRMTLDGQGSMHAVFAWDNSQGFHYVAGP